MKQFLICSAENPVTVVQPAVVRAETAEEAKHTYLRDVYSKERFYREFVMALSGNFSFLENFYLATPHEQERFNTDGAVCVENEVVISRLRSFFADRPELGEKYIRYMEIQDPALVDDEMFEFIAVRDEDAKGDLFAIDFALLPQIGQADDAKPSLEGLITLFRSEVVAKSGKVDPDNAYHWESLAFGWALGKGADIDLAAKLAESWHL